MCLTTIEMLSSLSKILRNMLTTNNNILLVLLNYDNSKTFPKLSVMYDVNLIFFAKVNCEPSFILFI